MLSAGLGRLYGRTHRSVKDNEWHALSHARATVTDASDGLEDTTRTPKKLQHHLTSVDERERSLALRIILLICTRAETNLDGVAHEP